MTNLTGFVGLLFLFLEMLHSLPDLMFKFSALDNLADKSQCRNLPI